MSLANLKSIKFVFFCVKHLDLLKICPDFLNFDKIIQVGGVDLGFFQLCWSFGGHKIGQGDISWCVSWKILPVGLPDFLHKAEWNSVLFWTFVLGLVSTHFDFVSSNFCGWTASATVKYTGTCTVRAWFHSIPSWRSRRFSWVGRGQCLTRCWVWQSHYWSVCCRLQMPFRWYSPADFVTITSVIGTVIFPRRGGGRFIHHFSWLCTQWT